MCDERIHSICYTITKYEVHNVKNGNNFSILWFSYNVYVMLYYKSSGFTKILKVKISVYVNLHSIHTARILGLSLEIMLNWWWWIVFCGMVDWLKAISLISSRVHCHRSSPSLMSDTPRDGFEPAQNLTSGLVEWSCAVVITTMLSPLK